MFMQAWPTGIVTHSLFCLQFKQIRCRAASTPRVPYY